MKLDTYHVVPSNDLREHDTDIGDDGSCWCKPVEADDVPVGTIVWVHNALDGREKVETGEAYVH